MRIINLKCSDEESFKDSILLSLHYYDISNNPGRITKLNKYENKYVFTHNVPRDFEANNPNIFLSTVDGNNNIILHPNNKSLNKVKIVKINYSRYAGLKPIKNKYIKLNELIKLFTQEELRDIIMQKIIY